MGQTNARMIDPDAANLQDPALVDVPGLQGVQVGVNNDDREFQAPSSAAAPDASTHTVYGFTTSIDLPRDQRELRHNQARHNHRREHVLHSLSVRVTQAVKGLRRGPDLPQVDQCPCVHPDEVLRADVTPAYVDASGQTHLGQLIEEQQQRAQSLPVWSVHLEVCAVRLPSGVVKGTDLKITTIDARGSPVRGAPVRELPLPQLKPKNYCKLCAGRPNEWMLLIHDEVNQRRYERDSLRHGKDIPIPDEEVATAKAKAQVIVDRHFPHLGPTGTHAERQERKATRERYEMQQIREILQEKRTGQVVGRMKGTAAAAERIPPLPPRSAKLAVLCSSEADVERLGRRIIELILTALGGAQEACKYDPPPSASGQRQRREELTALAIEWGIALDLAGA